MLTLKNNILNTKGFLIDSHDTTLIMKADVDCQYFGIITLTNNTTKVIQFIKFPSVYKARLIIYNEDLPYLEGAHLKILSTDASFSKESNIINLTFDIDKIKLTVKQSVSNDILSLTKELNELKQRLDVITLGKIIPNINILNQNYIKKGMVIVAADDKGNFTAAYPFANIITEINNQKAVDGVVILDASMIKYSEERTIQEQLNEIVKAFENIASLSKLNSEQLIKIKNDLANLTILVNTHLDSGIV
jgi:hypothetical protein